MEKRSTKNEIKTMQKINVATLVLMILFVLPLAAANKRTTYVEIDINGDAAVVDSENYEWEGVDSEKEKRNGNLRGNR